MPTEPTRPARRLNWLRLRWLIYLIILLGITAWRFAPRPWWPARTVETPHYVIASSASPSQTEEMGRVTELLYNAYSNRFGTLQTFRHVHPPLKLVLYKDRREMRWANPGLGWAEAFYRPPYCYAYYSVEEDNPYHWMLHEVTHQLNREVARVDLATWLDEGIAAYFSTSRIQGNHLALGNIDPRTYPAWWMDEMATATNRDGSLANGSLIPLRVIIGGSGGPDMDKEFNLYYLHWWTLVHYLFESPKYREAIPVLAQRGGGLDVFENTIGPVTAIEPEWYRHVEGIKEALSGKGLNPQNTDHLPRDP